MTSSQHGSYILGYTHATMDATMGLPSRKAERIPPKASCSDCRLKPACMKAELLVTAGQHTAVNTFPGLVHTARHVMGAANT
jgi:hypothetical protein